MMGVSDFWQMMIYGIMIIVAVIIIRCKTA